MAAVSLASAAALLVPAAGASSVAHAAAAYPFRDPSLSQSARLDDLMSRLTLDEKIGLLHQYEQPIPRLGIALFKAGTEALHGVAWSNDANDNGNVVTATATVFPQAIGMAATWDPVLVEKMGEVVSTEARARFNARPVDADRTIYQGLTIWSPNINIFRDPRWGRGQETYGEDPYLTGRLGVAFIRGLQGPDPSHPRVIATPKHFAVHSGPEAGRDSFSAQPSAQDLEATYLPAFRAAITEGKARSIMCSYNGIHGVPACANSMLLEDKLRQKWGFTGYTVSDCDAVSNIHLFQHYRPDAASAAAARTSASAWASASAILLSAVLVRRATKSSILVLASDAMRSASALALSMMSRASRSALA